MGQANEAAPLELGLAGAVTAAQVEELRETWLAGCWPGRAVRLDLGQVEGLHTAALQLVISLKRRVEESGGGFAIAGASPAVHQTAALLGLTGALGLGEGPLG